MSFVFDDAAVQTPFPVKNDERHDDADDDDDRRPILRRDDDDTPSPSRPKKTRADGRDDGGEIPPSSILHRCKTWMMTLLGYSRAGDKTHSAKVKMPSWRAIVWHFVSVGLILCSGFCIFQVFMMWSMSQSPIVVVLSGSMEPGYRRGDIMFLASGRELHNGDIVVFDVREREVPIVHRILWTHTRRQTGDGNNRTFVAPMDSEVWLNDTRWLNDGGAPKHLRNRTNFRRNVGMEMLTKGDNNFGPDVPLYAPGQRWLEEEDIVGVVRAHVPYMGAITLLARDYPVVKWVAMALLAILTFCISP